MSTRKTCPSCGVAIPPHRGRCDECRRRIRRYAVGAVLQTRARRIPDASAIRHKLEDELVVRYVPNEAARLAMGFRLLGMRGR